MKVIDYIHIKNTYGHSDSKIFFEEGLNYILGKRGAGKSVVLECIAFALYGSVALRDTSTAYKEIFVELSFNYSNEDFIIRRKINDASLLMKDKISQEYLEIANSTTIVNQKITNLLGYNYDIFLLSNYCKQKKLSHFSELTPAKRLQYIDKISGIEESKELILWLHSKRKHLKDKVLSFKKLIKTPILPVGVDLEFDYETAIEDLTVKLQRLYSLLKENNDTVVPYNLKPTLQLSSLGVLISEIPSNVFEELLKDRSHRNYLIESIQEIEQKLSAYNAIPSYIKTVSKEDAEKLVQFSSYFKEEHNILSCPSCSFKGPDNLFSPNIPILSDNLLSLIEEHSIKDVTRACSSLLDGTVELVGGLEETLGNLKREFEEISLKLPPMFKETSAYVLQNTFKDSLKQIEVYEKANKEYLVKERLKVEIEERKKLLSLEIESMTKSQEEDVKLKDLYIQRNQLKKQYKEQVELFEDVSTKVLSYEKEYAFVLQFLKDINTLTANIQKNIIPLINYHASKYLSVVSKGSMSKLEISPSYELIVDGHKIGVKSGGQQDLASLAFRLSLSQSVVTGMLPLFIADEVDASGGESDSDDVVEAINEISNNGFQILMTTHRNTENIENAHIVRL